MSTRHLPVRPRLHHLQQEARALLAAIHRDDAGAIAELRTHRGSEIEPARATLQDAEHVLARGYGAEGWPRLVLACRLIDAIWRDDVEEVRTLVSQSPHVLREDARGVSGNWGPPMSYAANLGRNGIVEVLRNLGAEDVQFAFERASLQGQIATATLLHSMGARPVRGSVMGPCETQSADGLAFLLAHGAELADGEGNRLAPVALLLETYCREPAGKHQCLELAAQHGVALPDTPVMALHRGRLDLLEVHLRRDPALLSRTFTHEDIYPPALGCSADQSLALHGTPLAGGTLLHLCVDYDEMEIARWLLAQGASADAKAAVDADGFGGHTPLFGCVVTQPIRLRRTDEFARLLLDHGADPNVRASLRKRLRFVDDETLHEYRDVTPLAWGGRFHDQSFVSRPAMRLIEERGGRS